jgi:DNA (cytosine-5)-methyltransferase 1
MTARVDPKLVREAWRRFGPLPKDHELIVDLFAGGGGASLGIEQALGRSPDVAINHDVEAVAMHAANHPATWHLISDVWEVAPEAVTAGRPVGLLWASPDCKHFSKAKGGRPVKKRIRALAWIVIKWARTVCPRVIILENVEEFATWGPLVQKTDGNGVKLVDLHGSPVMVPCKARRGQTFHRWRRQLERLGYRVEWRERRAYGSGAGTIRKRLYLIARRDGAPIVWPAATHGDPKKSPTLLPWVTAADCIDWSLPCPSIFDTAEEIMRKHGVRAVRPLRPKTHARLAKGTSRYVVTAAEPFIVPVTHGGGEGRAYPASDPLNAITGAHRGEHAVVTPFVTKFRNGATGQDAREPLATITAHQSATHPAGAAPLGVVAPYLARTDMTSAFERNGVNSAEEPARTQTTAGSHAVVAPFLVPRYGERPTQEPRALSAEEPMPVIVPTGNGAALVAPLLVKNNHGDTPEYPADEPTRCIVAGGNHHMVVSAFLAKHYGDTGQRPGSGAREPLDTITAQDHHAVVAAHVLNLRGSDRRDAAADKPLNTITGGGKHAAAVFGFLAKYYGKGLPSQPLDQPEHTVTVKPRIGLVEALAAAPPFGPEHYEKARKVAAFLRAHGYWDDREFVTITIDGIELVIVDIGMRMLTPRERFRAQGFAESYVIELAVPKDGEAAKKLGTWDRVLAAKIEWKKISAEAQGRMVGNSVCPTEARALAGANCGDLAIMREAATA